VIPTCFKQTTIVPVPKNTRLTCLNDYGKAGHGSHQHHYPRNLTYPTIQFVYHPNRSTDDSISIAFHVALSHLEKRNTYKRILFVDYSSAFNTIMLSKLITKLRTLGLNTSLCTWILDFLMSHNPGGKVR
jgi:hypothetical protein